MCVSARKCGSIDESFSAVNLSLIQKAEIDLTYDMAVLLTKVGRVQANLERLRPRCIRDHI